MKNKLLKQFYLEKETSIKKLGKNKKIKKSAADFIKESSRLKYSYNFTWLGRPIIQFPQDIIAVQEIIWSVKPDLIIETGIAHGGSLILSSSILEMIGGNGLVLGIDIDIRKHNRLLIENHPMFKRINMIEGSSTSTESFNKVKKIAENKKSIVVLLDSNHSHDHVLEELRLYSPMVTRDSYIVVFDTATPILSEAAYLNRPWSKENNPKTAVSQFLKENKNFVADKSIDNKLLISNNPGGYLKRI